MSAYPIRGRTLAQMRRPGWSDFGLPRDDSAGGYHNGFDFYAPPGTPIYGTGPGGVVTANVSDPGNLGNYVSIDYPDRWTQDCHMATRSPLAIGAAVGPTTLVGHVGHTGNAADVEWDTDEGPLWHDHHVLWVDGVRVDPLAYYATSIAGTGDRVVFQEKEDEMTLQIKHIYRKGVGEFILYASPTRVSLSKELSTLPAKDRTFEVNVATKLNGGEAPEFWDETPNGGWYWRNQLAARIAGMPGDYPLSTTNPFDALTWALTNRKAPQ